jgi:hypothetical protein
MGLEEKETWGVGTRTDQDLGYRLIWHRVVGEYPGEKIGTNDWTVSCREVASVAMTGVRREKSSSWTGKEKQGTKKSGRRGVDRWRGQRGNRQEGRGRDSEESGDYYDRDGRSGGGYARAIAAPGV